MLRAHPGIRGTHLSYRATCPEFSGRHTYFVRVVCLPVARIGRAVVRCRCYAPGFRAAVPRPRGAGLRAEVARRKPGVEPSNETVNVEHRQKRFYGLAPLFVAAMNALNSSAELVRGNGTSGMGLSRNRHNGCQPSPRLWVRRRWRGKAA